MQVRQFQVRFPKQAQAGAPSSITSCSRQAGPGCAQMHACMSSKPQAPHAPGQARFLRLVHTQARSGCPGRCRSGSFRSGCRSSSLDASLSASSMLWLVTRNFFGTRSGQGCPGCTGRCARADLAASLQGQVRVACVRAGQARAGQAQLPWHQVSSGLSGLSRQVRTYRSSSFSAGPLACRLCSGRSLLP